MPLSFGSEMPVLLQVEEGVETAQAPTLSERGSSQVAARRLSRQASLLEDASALAGRIPSSPDETMAMAVPWKGRMAWHVVNFGICLMLVGGDTNFCEDYANRASYNPSKVLAVPVHPIWPPDISSSAADFNVPAGRFFFVSMLLGGGLLLQSNVLHASICMDLDSSSQTTSFRIIRGLAASVCLALILTGTCNIQLLSTSYRGSPQQYREIVTTAVHLSGACVMFVALPIMELSVFILGSCSTSGGCRSFLRDRKVRIVRIVLSITALVCVGVFYHTQNVVSGEWNTYISKGYKQLAISDEWRQQTASRLNRKAYWFEYATAQCALAVIASRVFTVRQSRNVVAADTVTSEGGRATAFAEAPWFYHAFALGIQFACILAGVGAVMMNGEDPSNLCCSCSWHTGTMCEPLFTSHDGAMVCTSGPGVK